MTVSVHNPDLYMASLRQIIAQGRKRIGLLVGAGAPAGIFPPGSGKPLIPAVAGLTDMVMEALKADYGKPLDAVWTELETPNIETILSRVRSLAGVIGETKVHDLNGDFLEISASAFTVISVWPQTVKPNKKDLQIKVLRRA